MIFAVALAVAAVPEGLPAVLTVALALASSAWLGTKAYGRNGGVVDLDALDDDDVCLVCAGIGLLYPNAVGNAIAPMSTTTLIKTVISHAAV